MGSTPTVVTNAKLSFDMFLKNHTNQFLFYLYTDINVLRKIQEIINQIILALESCHVLSVVFKREPHILCVH